MQFMPISKLPYTSTADQPHFPVVPSTSSSASNTGGHNDGGGEYGHSLAPPMRMDDSWSIHNQFSSSSPGSRMSSLHPLVSASPAVSRTMPLTRLIISLPHYIMLDSQEEQDIPLPLSALVVLALNPTKQQPLFLCPSLRTPSSAPARDR